VIIGKMNFFKFVMLFLAEILMVFFVPRKDAFAAGRQQLHGHVPEITKTAPFIGRLEGATQLHLAVGLPLRNQESLQYLLKELYDSKSFAYRHFLTPEKFAQMFGPTESDYQEVIDFATAHHLNVTKTYINRALVDLTGTAADIENAFYVHLNKYNRADGTVFFAPDVEPSLDLNVSISHISGLDNSRRPRPCSGQIDINKFKNKLNRVNETLNFNENAADGSMSGLYIGQDFRNAYVSCTSDTGSNQSLALFEVDGFYSSDISSYETFAKNKGESIPTAPTLNTVTLDGFSGSPYSTGGNFEVSLDIEVAVAMAPGLSSINVYEGNPTDFIPDDILNSIANPPAGVPLSAQISSSWTWNSTTADMSLDAYFNQFAAQGQAFFQAAGDFGSYVSGNPTPVVPAPMDLVSNLTVVGGTELVTTSSGGSWSSESTWNNSLEKPASTSTPVIGYNSVGGGGICAGPTYTPVPIPTYQTSFINLQNGGSSSYRNIPDVSLVADYFFVVFNSGVTTGADGTSGATPLWAGFMALANQQLGASGNKGPVGFANPILYTLAASPTPYYNDFHDIADGSNNHYWNPTTTPVYPAVTGYDLATGLGSIKCNLISDLVGEIPTWTPTFTSTPTCSTGNGPSLSWSIKTPMTKTKWGLAAATLNGELYAAGGINKDSSTAFYTSSMYAYNPGTNSWSQAASMQSNRENFGLGSIGGNLYAVGGNTGPGPTNTMEVYNPNTNSWSYVASMPASLSNFGTGVMGGLLYVVGGDGSSNHLTSVETYNPLENQWSTVTSMPTGRDGLAVGVINKTLYAIGGYNGTSYLGTVEAYSLTTNAWTSKASMPTARAYLTVAVVGETLYAISGYNGNYLGTVEAYNSSADTWSNMPQAGVGGMSELASGVLNGTIYAVGGEALGGPPGFQQPYSQWINTAGVPDCAAYTATPTPTNTPNGGSMMPVRGGLVEVDKLTATFTPSFTPTVSSTPTPISRDAFVLVAVPNISRNGQPIQFQVILGDSAQINLTLYTLTGDRVYQTSIEGSSGLNTISWKLENQGNGSVASGLYIYSVQAIANGCVRSKMGKVVVMH